MISKPRDPRAAAARVRDGDGHGLEPFRWRQLFNRSLLQLRLPQGDGRELAYTVDVRHGGDREDGEVRAHLYLDGRHQAQSAMPAALPVPGGHIEVTMGVFGIRRCHYVTKDGAEQQLAPDPGTAEGRRARFDRERPFLGRCVGLASVVMLAPGSA